MHSHDDENIQILSHKIIPTNSINAIHLLHGHVRHFAFAFIFIFLRSALAGLGTAWQDEIENSHQRTWL